MRITLIGSGYVGLVTGACLAEFGHSVTCVDNDAGKIAALRDGIVPIFEPGLSGLVASNVAAGRLTFATDMAEPVARADVVFIAVGTPSRHGDGHADLTYVYAATAEIAKYLSEFTVVATKSTVPVGTGDAVEAILRENNPAAAFAVVSNPEFLREGAAIDDFKRPDRIVVGIEDERARAVMTEVYRPLYLNQAPLLFTSRRTAELVKYAANAFLAMKITFINEIADLSEKLGADVQDVARGIGLDNRIGGKFLNAGPGFGGSCFPKDTLALVRIGEEAGSRMRLVETTVTINDRRKEAMGEKIVAACGGDVRGKTIAVLGLTFKPNTDDMREAPSLVIVPALMAAGARVLAYDPEGMVAARALIPGLGFGSGPYDIAVGADAIVIITEWNEFRSLDLERLGTVMKTPVLVDLRNVYRRDVVERRGFTYESIGRPARRGGAG
ncbi:MAG: UDP-glucose/GDP-mannose dehydrogenase family protein [Hyphomicrobiales bacterium]|nr:UDP-glucose/GDP-mannose dehydrogenase family protein [Hyphomicrobiales bacterium]